jgi:hypothetical protein
MGKLVLQVHAFPWIVFGQDWIDAGWQVPRPIATEQGKTYSNLSKTAVRKTFSN